MRIPIDDPSFVERFLSHVDKQTGELTGCRDDDGYGILNWLRPAGERVKFRAHRVASASAYLTHTSGVIGHFCDHPLCCRPERGPARRGGAAAAVGQHQLAWTVDR